MHSDLVECVNAPQKLTTGFDLSGRMSDVPKSQLQAGIGNSLSFCFDLLIDVLNTYTLSGKVSLIGLSLSSLKNANMGLWLYP